MIYLLVVPDIHERAAVYEEIHEYEDLKQNQYEGLTPTQQERYQNHEAVNKIYVSLKPVVMQAIRNEIQSTVRVKCTIRVTLIPKS